MKVELKKFFEKIKNSKDSFLFLKLYYNPSSVLGDKQDMDEAEEEYNNLQNYCDLMLNNNLTEFINLLLNDDEFEERADLQIWRKLNFFLYDSADFKNYHQFQYDEDLIKLFTDKMTIIEYLDKKEFPHINGSVIGLISRYDIYKKYTRLFEYNYSKEQVESFDENEASNVRSWVNLRIDVIKEKTIDKQRKKEIALKWIQEDDYSCSNYDNVYLYRYVLKSNFCEPDSLFPGLCFTSLDNLVCENRFLDIMQQLLEQGIIKGIPLDNAIEIINMGIQIKSFKEPNADFFIKRLGKDLVKEFDIKKAQQLLSELILYKRKNENTLSMILIKNKGL